MPQNCYITTPLYYVNDIPHIGHAYTTTLADVLVRYHKLFGSESYLMTGTDEHGQKVQQAAKARGVEPQSHVDEYNLRFKQLWQRMDIQYDKFIRTTDSDHKAYVVESLQKLFEDDEIYFKEYAGWYSVSEERFFAEDELKDGKDPVSGKDVEWVEEGNYFFKMGSYQARLIQYITDNPDFIQPEFRKNEVLGFLRQDLQDLCISRPKRRLEWGIELPFDKNYVTYVWFDALLNYVSGVRHKKFSDGTPFWPASYHLIGKDILTTHAVYWTTMLMALKLPLPQHILAHGWWLNGGAKMSKSSGTAIDPFPYMDAYGVDCFRYYVMRDMVLGQDASFTDAAFIQRLNSDLANDLGNGLNRVTKLMAKHFDEKVPAYSYWGDEEEELKTSAQAVLKKSKDLILNLKLSHGIEEVFTLVRQVNKYLEVKAPWKLAKVSDKKDEFASCLVAAANSLAIALRLLSPIMPTKCPQGLSMLGISSSTKLGWGMLQAGSILAKAEGLFPRIEQKKVEVNPLAHFDFRVAKVVEVSDHPNADALFLLKLNDGSENPRQVCAGLKAYYSAEDMLNKKVLLFANLKPAKIRGEKSMGMLLAGDDAEGKAVLVEPGNLAVGSSLTIGDIEMAPKSKVSFKEFEKYPMLVEEGGISFGGSLLSCDGINPLCEAPLGASIH
jgi:methionyl-tRNA synthetase